MKYFTKNFTKKKKSNGDGEVGLPLPMPPRDHRTSDKLEGYSRPVDISLPPLRIIPRPIERSPRRVTRLKAISTGENDAVPLSPKMVKVLGADEREEEKMASYLKSQKKTAWGREWLPSDSELSNHSQSPRRDSTFAHVQTSQSPLSNRRGCAFTPFVMHVDIAENPNVANGSANRSAAFANRSVTPTNRSVANIIRAQECSTADWRMYRNNDDSSELGSPSSLQFSPSTTDFADSPRTGKASPIHDSRCSTPQRSPQKHLVSSQGKSFGHPHESCQKPCKLPSPPRSPRQVDRRSPACSSTVLQDLASRPLSLPSSNHYREPSPCRYKLTPPTSPRRRELKPILSAPSASCLHKPTPPTSPRPLKVYPVIHSENQDYLLSPRSSPQQSIVSSTYSDLPSNASPLLAISSQCLSPQRGGSGVLKSALAPSVVFMRDGICRDDGTFFAVKVSNSEHIPPEIHQEVAVLSKLRHPNIVQYYGTTTENGSICIFLELVKMGSLQTIMKNFQVFDETLMSSYTRQILMGLEYLHSMNTIHRDIKCANILVDSDGQVKLADFGLAKQMEESLATSVKGSPYYMAPEVLSPERNKRPYGLPVDIWSLGCTVLEMAEGKPPWSGLQGYAFFFKVTNGELPPIPEHLSDTAKDFITRCLRNCPEDRPTVKELLAHPFVAHAPRTFRASVPARD